VVLIDPPYEAVDEHARLADALSAAHRKWPTGIYALWYPIKDTRETERFARRIAQLGVLRVLRAELTLIGRPEERLRGSGFIVVNPPWTLEAELRIMLPALAGALARESRTHLDWLAGEK
jgi:23S rRNA (adenine2030-N6)-methyltransferase